MEKKQQSRRHSTGNLMLEVTSAGYEDVLSRYLSPPLPSCHDHCKPSAPTGAGFTRATTRIKTRPNKTTHVKPINPGSTTKSSLPPTDQSKTQDFMSTSDPFYIPPSRITRRYSDVILPTNVATSLAMTSKKKVLDSIKVQPTRKSNPVGKTNKSQGSENQTSRPSENKKAATRVPRPNEEDLSSQKLKFRQGKTIDSQSDSNNGRKLKFQQGKVLDVNQNGEKDDGKSLRRRLSSSGGMNVSPAEINPISVALKPCDHVEPNKSNTRLNNVIEETASRLIQTRKSKVQALVGAFEMISANEF